MKVDSTVKEIDGLIAAFFLVLAYTVITSLSVRASRIKPRLAIIFIIALMVISLPILVLADPALVSAVASSDPAIIATPSTLTQDGSDFTT